MNAIASIATAPAAELSPQKMAAINHKAEEFEALVLSQLLAPMFDSVKTPSLFGEDGPEQDTFRSLLNDEYAKAIAARGGIGIADQVKDALIRIQSNNA